MNRRTFLKTASVAPAAGAVALAAPAAPATTLTTQIVRLNLQHTWTTTMSSSASFLARQGNSSASQW